MGGHHNMRNLLKGWSLGKVEKQCSRAFQIEHGGVCFYTPGRLRRVWPQLPWSLGRSGLQFETLTGIPSTTTSSGSQPPATPALGDLMCSSLYRHQPKHARRAQTLTENSLLIKYLLGKKMTIGSNPGLQKWGNLVLCMIYLCLTKAGCTFSEM